MSRCNAIYRMDSAIAKIPKHGIIVIALLIATSSGLSALMVWSYATAPAGYAAVYANASVLGFAGVFVLLGLALILPVKTRWIGVVSMLSAAWLVVSFMIAANLAYRFNRVSWKNERMVSILPESGQGYYIYFRPGTSDEAVEQFSNTILHRPRTDKGQDLLPGVNSYARLASSQGREIVAVGLHPSLTIEERRDLRVRIESQAVVSEVADHLIP
jgi:hypothetical protein